MTLKKIIAIALVLLLFPAAYAQAGAEQPQQKNVNVASLVVSVLSMGIRMPMTGVYSAFSSFVKGGQANGAQSAMMPLMSKEGSKAAPKAPKCCPPDPGVKACC